MLRHAQIHNVVSQMPQKSDSAIFYKRKRCTTFFFNRIFSKKWGQALCACVGPPGPPPFFGKTFYWKELLCTVCVYRKWEWRFLKHLAVLTLWICACLSIFSLQKDWIRIFWTFIDSKKVNPCFFLLARSSAKIKSLLFEIF